MVIDVQEADRTAREARASQAPSDPATAPPARRASGSESNPSFVQAGWEIASRDGHPLGEVLGADERRFLLRDRDDPAKRLEFPTALVDTQEVGTMRASIVLDEDEVACGRHGIERIPRERPARSGTTS
jgi:hypothetical protein